MSSSNTATGNKRSLLALIGVVLVGMTGFGVFLPVFPFLALHVGASPMEATWAMGAYSLGQLISAPAWGRVSDRIGRKPVLMIGLIGGGLCYLWLAQAQTVIDVALARLAAGLMAGNVGAAFAAAADLADEKTRARNMGLLGASVGFAFIAGPFVGAMIAGENPDAAGFDRICIISACFAFAAALLALVLFRETKAAGAASADQPKTRFALMLSKPALTRLFVVMLLMIVAQAAMETTFGLWADIQLDWGPRQVGWALAGLGFLSALLQGGVAGRAAQKLGERLTLIIGLIILAAAFGGLAMAKEAPMAMVALCAIAIGVGLASPALQSLFAAEADHGDRGAIMGLSQSAGAMGRVLGPLFAGPLFGLHGHAAPYVLGVGLSLLALFFSFDARPALSSEATSSE